MSFTSSDKFRLHKEDQRWLRDNSDDSDYHKDAWRAFRWFLIGETSCTIILEVLRIAFHPWRW